MKIFKTYTEIITLTQFLKANDYIGSGGQAKFFLQDHEVLVNKKRRTERKKKLYDGDIVKVLDDIYLIKYDQTSNT